MEKEARIVRVVAERMESKNGLIEASLEHAVGLVEQAAEGGAKLVLLPEFMPTGYMMTRAMCDAAESKEGPTVEWLEEDFHSSPNPTRP